jgi:predicted amidophosphoribosyltransferase
VSLARLAAELLALVAPPACVVCRAPLPGAEAVLCAPCRRELPWLRRPPCARCGLPAPCRPCPARDAPFERAWAPMAHEGAARALVVALKYHGALPVADVMAAQITARAPAGLLDGAALVPVPAHPARRRHRGFDQAERLARALSARTGRPLNACLRRTGAATSQIGAGRSQRRLPGRLSFEPAGPAPEVAVLVDDVHTTGATLRACAACLRAGGTRDVRCVTYARALAAGS